MRGLHCIADLQGCNPLQLNADKSCMMHFILQAIAQVGLQAVAQQSYQFAPNLSNFKGGGGITLTVLLAESHVCIHTWPELGGVTLDVYVCNVKQDNQALARQLMAQLIAWFEPTQLEQQFIERGKVLLTI